MWPYTIEELRLLLLELKTMRNVGAWTHEFLVFTKQACQLSLLYCLIFLHGGFIQLNVSCVHITEDKRDISALEFPGGGSYQSCWKTDCEARNIGGICRWHYFASRMVRLEWPFPTSVCHTYNCSLGFWLLRHVNGSPVLIKILIWLIDFVCILYKVGQWKN